MYTGYLQLGGVEIANADRLRGYLDTADCVIPSFLQTPCGTLQDALGDHPYDVTEISRAPWYDPTNPDVSSRFYGVAAYDITGLHDSTRSVPVTQAIRDGGILGDPRRETKSVKVRAILHAKGEDALDYGLNWLNSALDPRSCGQHGDSCGFSDLSFLTTCPPPMPTYWTAEDAGVVATNLFTNPNLVGSGTWTEIRRNVCQNPGFEGGTVNGWVTNAGGTGVTFSAVTEEAHSGTYSCKVVSEGLGSNRGINQHVSVAPACPDGIVTASAWVKFPAGAPFRFDIQERDPSGTYLNAATSSWTGTGEWQRIHLTRTDVAPGNKVTTPIFVLSGSVTFYVDDVLVEWTDELLPDFNGSSPDGSVDPDMRSRYLGAVTLSESVLEGESVTYAVPYQAGSTVIKSSRTIDGHPSVRVITSRGTGATVASGVRFNVAGSQPSGRWSGAALVSMDANTPGPMRYRLSFHNPFTTAYTEDHNAPGEWMMRATVDGLSAGTTRSMVVSAWYGEVAGKRPDFWVAIPGLFVGDYDGAAFSGSTVDPGAHPDFRYRWVGAPNGSASEKIAQQWTEHNDVAAMDELMRPIERYMHEAAVTSGVTVREYLGSRQNVDGMKAADVEFTITSERGYIYTRPRPVSLLTIPDAYEDVQKNLFLNPTADNPTATRSAIRFNLVPDPSLESGASGWTGAAQNGGASVPVTAARVEGELRAVGSWSYKVVPSAAATSVYATMQKTIPADSRYALFGVWGAVLDPGNVVTALRAEYRIGAAGAWIEFDRAPNVAAAKGGRYYKAAAPVQLPAAATSSVGIRFVAESAAGTVTVYADAAMAIWG